MIRELLEKAREKREMEKNMDREYNVHNKLMEKRKSANERELEKYMEEDRQKRIKKELEFHRKKKDNEYNYGHKILTNNNKLIKQKNIFKNNRRLF